ncbi:MAG: acyl-CoA dehydrogenase, partial [Candidatus Methanolliviera hydrocarbonicum]
KARLYKMWLADRAVEDVGKAMDLMGLYGCDREHDIEKHWRDIKIIQLWMGGKQLCQMETARWFYECETL